MDGGLINRLQTILSWLLAGFSLWFIGCFLAIALLSITYPFGLEWIEGQSLDVVQRIRDGLPVYTKPSLEYVAFIYTPLYYYVTALFSYALGVGFVAARLVSLLAACGTLGIMFFWLRKEGASQAFALYAAGLYAATYTISGRWFDISRVDSLFLFFWLAGAFAFVQYRELCAAVFAGLCLLAAFFTKQSALFALPPLAVYGLWAGHRRDTLTLLAAALLPGAALCWIAGYATEGWFGFFVFTLPAAHAYDWANQAFWEHDIPKVLPMVIMAVAYGLTCTRQAAKAFAVLIGALAASYASRMHSFAAANVLMPFYASLALCGGLALCHIKGTRLQAIVMILAAVQFALLLYNPQKWIPTPQMRAGGEQFLKEVRGLEGSLFMPEITFIQRASGQKSYALGMAAFDVLRADLGERNDVKADLRAQIRGAVESGRFAYIAPGHFVFRGLANNTPYESWKNLEFPGGFVTGEVRFRNVTIWRRITQN